MREAVFRPRTRSSRAFVVSDVDRSRGWYVDLLGATVVRECGGSSSVLRLLGGWLLLVTGGGPTADKPTVTLAPPEESAACPAIEAG